MRSQPAAICKPCPPAALAVVPAAAAAAAALGVAAVAAAAAQPPLLAPSLIPPPLSISRARPASVPVLAAPVPVSGAPHTSLCKGNGRGGGGGSVHALQVCQVLQRAPSAEPTLFAGRHRHCSGSSAAHLLYPQSLRCAQLAASHRAASRSLLLLCSAALLAFRLKLCTRCALEARRSRVDVKEAPTGRC